jgi:MFS family permease
MEEKFLTKYYLIFFSTILGPLTTNSLVPIFEELRINFGLNSIALISLAISIYTFPFAIFQLFTGAFSDVVDKIKVVTLGFMLFTSGLILTLIAVLMKLFYWFLIGFLIQGIGFAFINPTILAILSIISPERKKGVIMGLYNSSAGIGISLGVFLSGFLASYFLMWRLLFVLNPIIAILALILFLSALKNCEVLVCKSYESTIGKSSSHKDSKIITTLNQIKTNLKVPVISLGLIGFICFFIVITLTNTLNEQIRNSLSNLNNQEIIFYVSLILTINGIISIVLSPITGLMLRKINPSIMMTIGFIFMIAIIFMPFVNNIIWYMLISFLIYIGSAFIWPALFQETMDLNSETKGTNSAILNSFRFIGYSVVGIFYLLLGIPGIYFIAMLLNILGILIIVVFIKLYAN